MKKLICCVLMLILLVPAVLAEQPYDSVRLSFEDGFSLSLPADWVSYTVEPELAESGYIYCLGSADGTRLMYIQRWNSDLNTPEELTAVMEERGEIELRSADSGCDFLMYSFADADASGCMTLLGSSILNFVFTPKSDAEQMLIAASVVESFEID